MRRRDLLRGGLALPMVGLGCRGPTLGRYADLDVRFSGRVLVIGAGAAGLAAGYLLSRYGADYAILEASDRWGGRVRRLDGFLDFPIDLGAEWLHADPELLATLVDDPAAEGSIDLVRYTPQTLQIFDGDGLQSVNWVQAYYGEYKFKNTTWYGFLERYITPASADRLRLNTPVVAIDTTGPRVRVTLEGGEVEEADRVLVAVPLPILQDGVIAFTPPLPDAKQQALDSVEVTDGLKVFLSFEERFYPDLTVMRPITEPGAGDYLFIDGAFRKDAAGHLGTLFCVGPNAESYVEQDDAAIVEQLVSELDTAFDGAASRLLIDAVVQNWSAEPWIRGAYGYDWSGPFTQTLEALAADIEQRIYWAGSGLSLDATSTVHGAMETGYEAVARILTEP